MEASRIVAYGKREARAAAPHGTRSAPLGRWDPQRVLASVALRLAPREVGVDGERLAATAAREPNLVRPGSRRFRPRAF